MPAAAATQNFACDSTGNVTMGTSQGAEMAQFIEFVACLGQSKMAQLGYSPIPPNLVEDDFQAAGRLPGGVRLRPLRRHRTVPTRTSPERFNRSEVRLSSDPPTRAVLT